MAVTAVLILTFGIRLVLRRRNTVAIAFLTTTVAVSVWLISFAAMYASVSEALALAWARRAYFGVPFIAPAVYWFTTEILRIEVKRRVLLVLMWIAAAWFSAAGSITGVLVPAVRQYWWGFYPLYDPFIGAAFVAFFFGSLIAALLEFLRAMPHAEAAERKRTQMLIAGFLIAYSGCVDYLPKFGIAVYPFGYLGILGFVGIAAWTIRRFDLIPLTPSLAATEIIGAMGDALFVCDRNGRIEFANRAAETMLGYGENELTGRSFDSLLVDRADITSRLGRDTVRSLEQVFVMRSGEMVDVMLSIAPVILHGDRVGAVIIGRDMRERKRDLTARIAAEKALRSSEERYRLLFEQNAAGVCVSRLDGIIVDCNATFATLLGYKRNELLGKRLAELFANPGEADELSMLLHTAETLNSVEIEMRRADGAPRWVLQNMAVTGEGSERVVHITVVDISDRKRAEEQIEFHAYHDVLTHLPNRRLFHDHLRHALLRARRSGRPVGVMFVDIDHFKSINDTLGHTAGDELLLEMSLRLRNCIREDDTVARLGGDEFTIILELREPEDAVVIAQKILEAIRAPLSVGGLPIAATASLGIALYPVDGTDPESLLRNADSAMYRAKQSGRNTYQLCTDEMKARAIERLTIESRLRNAIDAGELMLAWQPQISLVTGRVIGAEALLRWNDPSRGLLEPDSFLRVAEESPRLVAPIAEWVLRAACNQAREWRDRNPSRSRVSVNVSPRQFQQTDLLRLVESVLRETGVDPSLLDLEISESTAMQNTEATIAIIRALRDLGVGVSIDDFGMGSASLHQLMRMPVTGVKIDRAFMIDLSKGGGDDAVVAALCGMARRMSLRVTAEGVETAQQLDFLRQCQCDDAQGFYFARPMPAADLDWARGWEVGGEDSAGL
jgi:diguanylate cyclase (GGDEF)-like protein/PAS domain S-box-containing protein